MLFTLVAFKIRNVTHGNAQAPHRSARCSRFRNRCVFPVSKPAKCCLCSIENMKNTSWQVKTYVYLKTLQHFQLILKKIYLVNYQYFFFRIYQETPKTCWLGLTVIHNSGLSDPRNTATSRHTGYLSLHHRFIDAKIIG